MIAAVQRVAALIGEAGCYFLCILRIAAKLCARSFDVLAEYIGALSRGRMNEACFVYEPGQLLADFTGGAWRVLKAGDGLDSSGKPYDLPLSYKPVEGEMEIDRYERVESAAGKTTLIGHFVVGDGVSVEWDPYGESRTVRDGHLVSRRIFRRTA